MYRKRHEIRNPVWLTIDGERVAAEPGESVAAVLLRTPPFTARATPLNGAPRTPYCMMGVCHDCLAIVDGRSSTQTCRVTVAEGMTVERQIGARKPE